VSFDPATRQTFLEKELRAMLVAPGLDEEEHRAITLAALLKEFWGGVIPERFTALLCDDDIAAARGVSDEEISAEEPAFRRTAQALGFVGAPFPARVYALAPVRRARGRAPRRARRSRATPRAADPPSPEPPPRARGPPRRRRLANR
jgi:hypothetical protein